MTGRLKISHSFTQLGNDFTLLTRRQLLRGVAITAAGSAFLLDTMGAAAAKMTQKAAGYQTKPKNGQSCSSCQHFKPPASCDLVGGKISPNGWCRFYAKKGPY